MRAGMVYDTPIVEVTTSMYSSIVVNTTVSFDVMWPNQGCFLAFKETVLSRIKITVTINYSQLPIIGEFQHVSTIFFDFRDFASKKWLKTTTCSVSLSAILPSSDHGDHLKAVPKRTEKTAMTPWAAWRVSGFWYKYHQIKYLHSILSKFIKCLQIFTVSFWAGVSTQNCSHRLGLAMGSHGWGTEQRDWPKKMKCHGLPRLPQEVTKRKTGWSDPHVGPVSRNMSRISKLSVHWPLPSQIWTVLFQDPPALQFLVASCLLEGVLPGIIFNPRVLRPLFHDVSRLMSSYYMQLHHRMGI